jgi:hypothetical protein
MKAKVRAPSLLSHLVEMFIIISINNSVTPFSLSIARKIPNLEQTVQGLQCTVRVHEKKHQCETMFANGRIYDAAQYLLDIIDIMNEELKHNELIANWLEGDSLSHFVGMSIHSLLSGFRNKCLSRLRVIGDDASIAENHVEAFSAYSAILSLTSSPLDTVLVGWARMGLRSHTVNEVLGSADKVRCGLHGRLEWLHTYRAIQFLSPKFRLYRAVCDVLQEDDRVTEAIEYFRKMKDDLLEETHALDDRPQWELGE